MFIIALILSVIIFLFLYLDCRKPKGYPPGPRWWPILGCVLEVVSIYRKNKYIYKTCLEFRDKYGPVVGLKIGKNHIVMFNNVQSMRAMLLNEHCDGRPKATFFHARSNARERRGILMSDGQLCTEQRRFVMRYLREFNFSDTTIAILEDEACILLEHLKKLLQDVKKFPKIKNNNVNNENNNETYKLQKDNMQSDRSKLCNKFSVIKDESLKLKYRKTSDVYIKAEEYEGVKRISESKGIIIEMTRLFDANILNIMWRMLVENKRLNIGDRKFERLYRIVMKILTEINMFAFFFNHFSISRFITQTSGNNSFVEGHRELWNFIEEELQYCKKTLDPNATRGLIDIYLTALASEKFNNSFNESQLIAICLDLFIAGNETTSNSLAFGFLYLILFPRVQRKAQEEIDRVIGRDRLPTLADKSKMPYVQAVVFECIRVFIGRSMNVPHRALRDTTILGHKIPKDTILLFNLSGVMFNDQFYDEPENFRPERFLDNNGNIVMPSNYFPFGLGKRRCMGDILAKNNIFIIISTLLQNFNFSVVPGEPEPSTEDLIDTGITISPQPFRALVSLRV